MIGFSGTYDLVPSHWEGGIYGNQIYEFQNDQHDPLTYEDSKGNLIRPDNHQMTDMGSVPLSLQALLPKWFSKDRYIPAYYYHDDAYRNHGWWFAVKGGWEFKQVTRSQADSYLFDMILSLGGSRSNAWAIWLGVRIGGAVAWNRKISKPSE